MGGIESRVINAECSAVRPLATLTATAVRVLSPSTRGTPLATKLSPLTIASMPLTVTVEGVRLVTVPLTVIADSRVNAPDTGSVIATTGGARSMTTMRDSVVTLPAASVATTSKV